MSDERFARQYRFGPPPGFLLASTCTSIVHHLSGPSASILARYFTEDPTPPVIQFSRTSHIFGFSAFESLTLPNSHLHWTPWPVFQDGWNQTTSQKVFAAQTKPRPNARWYQQQSFAMKLIQTHAKTWLLLRAQRCPQAHAKFYKQPFMKSEPITSLTTWCFLCMTMTLTFEHGVFEVQQRTEVAIENRARISSLIPLLPTISRTLSLSFQSSFHLSLMVLIRYRSLASI